MILTANSSLTSDDNTEEASGGEVGEDGTSIAGAPSGNEADSKSLLDLPWYGVSMEYTPMCDVSEHLSFEKPMQLEETAPNQTKETAPQKEQELTTEAVVPFEESGSPSALVVE